MYVSLICFLFTGLIFIIYGKSFIIKFCKQEIGNYNTFDSFFIGLCLTGTILNFWSLFLPVDVFSLLFLSSGAVCLVYFNKTYFLPFFNGLRNQIFSHKIFFLLVLVAIIITLLYGLVTPRNYDSYLYHINAIQWNEMYGTVPGLANFHDRFGLNSSVFVLSAAFSYNFLYNQYIFIISSLSYLVLFIWILKQIVFKKGIIALFSILFLYFFTAQYANDISSPATDLLPNILVGYVLLSILFDSEILTKKTYLFIILPLFCITLKLSTFPIIFIGLFAIYSKKAGLFKTLFQFVGFSSLLILPWMIKNIILTGYLIYPMAELDLFNFDWEVSRNSVLDIKKWITSWARIPMKNHDEVLAMTFNEWFSVWWNASLTINKIFYSLAAVAPLIFIIYNAFNTRRNKTILLTVLVAYLGLTFWFITAPDIRFSFAFVLFLALLPLFFFKSLVDKVAEKINPLLIISAIYCLFLIGKNGYKLFCEDYISAGNFSEYVYLPLDASEIKDKRNIKFNSVVLVTKNGERIELFEPNPDHAQCFDKFPCSWYVDQRLKLRGEDLEDGFCTE
ncbi:LIC_10190 family membrane protein [Flavobacterium sp.]|jgi:hypothetical protein|uniref:LIC_10190 family membrane protein n=1 Tax=Flavobacterium sp. TaxID=239 RepID=UPI003782D2EC